MGKLPKIRFERKWVIFVEVRLGLGRGAGAYVQRQARENAGLAIERGDPGRLACV